MGYVDLGLALQLEQLLLQHVGAEMLRGDRQLALAIRKRRFDDEIAQIADLVDGLPQFVADRGVAAERQAGLAGIEAVADRRNGMVGRQGG